MTTATTVGTSVENYVGGRWVRGNGEVRQLYSPADGRQIGQVALSTKEDVDAAVGAARAAFPEWSETPLPQRIRYLFALRERMESCFDELAELIVLDEGKTVDDAQGEVRRAIENVEVACGTPMLLGGTAIQSIARGIDSTSTYYPIGVAAIVSPFNFPLMVPMWFLPYAIACGNTVVLKPSEQVPLTIDRFMRLLEETRLPPGVVNVLQGERLAVEALITHPGVDSVSFVGSETVARSVYKLATGAGKRAQCLGGAKNYLVVMPDADPELTRSAIMGSAFGGAGERCLAGSVLVPVGERRKFEPLIDSLINEAGSMKVGNGLDPATQLGPVVSADHQRRVIGHIDQAISQGAKPLLDGRPHAEQEGYYVGPTILDEVEPDLDIVHTEVFGPVLGVMRADSVQEAVASISKSRYGNAAAIFTSSGGAAREFVHTVPCGMVGVNIGVAAPMAYFPFTGWRQSFFGDLNAQGRDSVRFFTRPKVTISRW